MKMWCYVTYRIIIINCKMLHLLEKRIEIKTKKKLYQKYSNIWKVDLDYCNKSHNVYNDFVLRYSYNENLIYMLRIWQSTFKTMSCTKCVLWNVWITQSRSLLIHRMMDMAQSLFIALSWVSIKYKRQIIDIAQHNNNLNLSPSLMM